MGFTSLTDKFVLENGYGIPCIGYGTWLVENGDVAVNSVAEAIRAGYRHIDTAARYGNEESVGRAVAESGIDRSQIHLTSKVWNTERGYDKVMAAFERSLKALGTDYLDLYLVHWPASPSQFDNWEDINRDTWRAMMDIYRSGRAKAIGVSNFKPHHLAALMDAEIRPMADQIEYHPGRTQAETVKFCQENGIQVEAWSPLGRAGALGNETICAIAGAHGKTAAQVCIRWCLQNNVLPLPKSVTPSRILSNTDVFDFELTAGEMEAINTLDLECGPNQDPDKIDF